MTSRFLRAGIIAAGAIFLSGFAAQGADLRAPSYKSPAFVAPAYFSWSGFYVGINGGYGFGKSNWAGPPSTGDFNIKGPVVGGTVGYNYQIGSWVFGLELDADYSGIKGSTTNTCAGGCETSNTWLATGRARIGYAWDRWLPYITGGAAYGNEKASFAGNSESKTQLGWTAGLGVEYAFLGAWTAKLEYLYVDLGKWNCSAATCGVASDIKFNANLVRLGVNYRF